MCLYLFIFFLQTNPEQYCCKNRVLKCDKYRLENALLSSTRNFDQKRLGKRTEGLQMLWVLSFRAKNRCIYQLRDSFIFIVRCWQLHVIIRKPCHTKLVRRNNPKKISGDFSNLVIPILFSEIRKAVGSSVFTSWPWKRHHHTKQIAAQPVGACTGILLFHGALQSLIQEV